MVSVTLASTVVMGLLAVAIVVAASRYATAPERPDDRLGSAARLSASLDDPSVLGGIFVVLALLVAGVTLGAVGALGVPSSLATAFFTGVVAVIGLLLAGFLFLGPFAVTRSHGLGDALATVAGVTMIGFALLAVIAARLLGLF